MSFRVNSARLLLRPWQPDDFEPFAALARDPEVMRYIGRGECWSESEIRGFIARQSRNIETSGYGLGPLVCRSDGCVVGQAGLQTLGTSNQVEIGWWLARKHWGAGLASEMGHALVRFAFEEAGLERVVAITNPANAASIRVIENLDMRFQRRFSGRELGLRDAEVEVLLYQLDRSTYRRDPS